MFRRAPIVSPMNSVLRAIVPVVPSASRSTIALAQSTSVLNYICILHCLFRQYIPKHLLRFILYILLYSLHHSDKNRHLFISLHGTFIKLLFIFDSRSQLVSHQRGWRVFHFVKEKEKRCDCTWIIIINSSSRPSEPKEALLTVKSLFEFISFLGANFQNKWNNEQDAHQSNTGKLILLPNRTGRTITLWAKSKMRSYSCNIYVGYEC